MKPRCYPVLVLLLLGLPLVPGAGAAESFDSGNLEPGISWSFTFTEENQDGYAYHCHPHPWMQAMVHVMPDTDGETTAVRVNIIEDGDEADWGYSVEHLVIEVGDRVIWANMGDSVHTVTSMATTGDEHEHDSHEHDSDDSSSDAGSDAGNDAPGFTAPMLILLLGAVALVAAARRR